MEQRNVISKSSMRDSGIELLKIIAIGLIVIGHVIQTLRSKNEFVSYSDYIVECEYATTNIKVLLLILMSHFGALGNWLFFTASAWFLLDSTKVSKKKMMEMLVDIWVISIVILGITVFIRGGGGKR